MYIKKDLKKINYTIIILSTFSLFTFSHSSFSYQEILKDAKIEYHSSYETKDEKWKTFIDEIGMVRISSSKDYLCFVAFGNPKSDYITCRDLDCVFLYAQHIPKSGFSSVSDNRAGYEEFSYRYARASVGLEDDFTYSNPTNGVHIWKCHHSYLSIDFNIDSSEPSKARAYYERGCTEGCAYEFCPKRID